MGSYQLHNKYLSALVSSHSWEPAAHHVQLVQGKPAAHHCPGSQTCPPASTSKDKDSLSFPGTSLDSASCFSRPGLARQHQLGCYSWCLFYSASLLSFPHLFRKHHVVSGAGSWQTLLVAFIIIVINHFNLVAVGSGTLFRSGC